MYRNDWTYISQELRRIELLLYIRVLQSRWLNQQDGCALSSASLDEFRGLILSDEEIDDLLLGQFDNSSVHNISGHDNVGIFGTREVQALVGKLRESEVRIREKRDASLEQEVYLSLPHLCHLFQLTAFEEQVVLLCLAPELDRKYERIYAYLQDDITQKKPSVNFALSMILLGEEIREKGSGKRGKRKGEREEGEGDHNGQSSLEAEAAAREFFSADATLLRCKLVQFIPEAQDGTLPLLARHLKLDDRIVNFLLESDQIDERIRPFARLVEPQITWEQVQTTDDLKSRAVSLTRSYFQEPEGQELASVRESGQKLVYLFQGQYGAGKKEVAEALCQELGIRLVVADVAEMLSGDLAFDEAVWLLFRESLLLPAAIYLERFERLVEVEVREDAISAPDNHARLRALVEAVEVFSLLTFLDSEILWEPVGEFEDHLFMTVDFPMPDYPMRKAWWDDVLASSEFPVSPDVDPGELASKFRISGGQIRDAFIKARNLALWRNADDGQIQMDDLYNACRAKSNQGLSRLAQKIQPKYTWDDIVLPPDQVAQLREICDQSRYRHVVYGEWGFDRKLSFGKGLNALFTGPPGTGKTMAAEVIASELYLDLYKIDLSQVVSKYIGETEKNLDRIFREAQGSNAILFFDEADALFGKRSEVKDAHDRYANIEIGYLLQKMEEYDGIAILATNMRKNMDEAFVRRMQFIVEFPFPDEDHRRRIWEVTFPQEVPLCDDVDFGLLAREVKLAGGNIKNIALAGAFLAASDDGIVRMSHLIHAARREHDKLGQVWDDGLMG